MSPKDKSLKLGGKWKVGIIGKEIDFSATAKPAVKSDSVLYFEVPQISAGDLKIGLDTIKNVISKISPKIDLGDYKVRLSVNDISFTANGLHLAAHAESADEEE